MASRRPPRRASIFTMSGEARRPSEGRCSWKDTAGAGAGIFVVFAEDRPLCLSLVSLLCLDSYPLSFCPSSFLSESSYSDLYYRVVLKGHCVPSTLFFLTPFSSLRDRRRTISPCHGQDDCVLFFLHIFLVQFSSRGLLNEALLVVAVG